VSPMNVVSNRSMAARCYPAATYLALISLASQMEAAPSDVLV
jgi:hypothetical protein